jgi:outer membrane receptor protein involved in Fe transport
MTKKSRLLSSALIVFSAPVFAQDGPPQAESAQAAAETTEIVVTATRRSIGLSDVPLAVSAVSAESLRNGGVHDIRQLNQLSPSLNVTSSQSEAAGAVARIRGVGTIGDNPGLENSVATFIDGVYRSRSSVALTELGAIDRIEVLRGPQGTLFGRNAAAGLINVITAGPSYEEAGTAELSYGNYDYWRAAMGLTGPIGGKIAYRLDGVYMKRDGFLKESDDYIGSSGRDFNDRDRWLVRGQLKLDPVETLSVRLIADYAKRDEQCCAATFLPANESYLAPDGTVQSRPNSFAALERRLGAVINDDTFDRRVSVTPGRDYRSDVKEWGVSAEVDWDLGDAKLTSITSYRDWQLKRRQDADFTNLDIIYRDHYNQQFKTFTQELRLQGKAFDNRLDWLIGAYYADEKLNLDDSLRYGADYGLLQGCRVAAAINPAAIQPGAAGCLNPAARPAIAASLGPLATPLLSGLDQLAAIGNSGATNDRFRQKDRTWALFTHNVISLTDKLFLTLGARYTHDRKTLDASVASDTSICATQGFLRAVTDNPALPGSARRLAGNILALSCANAIGGGIDGGYRDRISDNQWTGTAVLSFKPTDRLMTYASYSKGYKAGGFNLDRAGLSNFATSGLYDPSALGRTGPLASQLRFAPEKVDAFEVGAKYRGRGFRVAATLFYQMFDDFQLNTFNGLSFVVENISGCSSLAGGSNADGDLDVSPGTAAQLSGVCDGKKKSGVISKGVELEASFIPFHDLSLDAGFTYANTRYRHDVAGLDGRPLPTPLFAIPGKNLSNAPRYVAAGGATWTPPLGIAELRALVHADARWQSRSNTGSDLFPEKFQSSLAVVNARVGVTEKDQGWSVELWGQNIFNKDYRQVVANAPIQGSGSSASIPAGNVATADSLFIVFPAEPRTYGMTVRTKF